MIEWFHSRSPEPWKRWLSNFALYDPSGGFPSVESQFQAVKFCYSDSPEHRWTIPWSTLSAVETKRVGTKSYFRKHNIHLDTVRWDRDRDSIMKELLQIRFQKDPEFRTILRRCKKEGVRLFHYSLRDRYWGAFQRKADGVMVGENRLGSLMEQLIENDLSTGRVKRNKAG